ncbi:MAG TPA: aminotransferase class V-fold PLP-dependent enzyme [Roseiflexaceae bacterium]|nr:aminotransferase class V-fold PLP-dependent enzyme [Roseiflexaceae bacterium]
MQPSFALPQPDLARHFLLRPDVAFLNHGSFGACPRPVFETYQRWQRELEQEPVQFLGRRVNDLLAEARGVLAQYLQTTPANLVFVPNATFGINIVARSLQLGPDDEVLTTNHEYGAVDRTWRFLSSQRGFRYIAQPITTPLDDVDAFVEQFWAGVTPRTRVIALSHITSPTALIFPVAEICRRAREAGILTVIDGAHAPGQIELDLDAIGADFYTGNCHKWLCAPKGAAFLYACPEYQSRLTPLVVSWGYESRSPSGSTFQDYFGWTGTSDPSAYLSVPAAIAFQQEHDWPSVRAACHNLLQELSDAMHDWTGLPHLSADSTLFWSQMRAFPLPPCDPAEVHGRLFEEYLVEVPLMAWQDQTLVRVSIQAYNTPDDVRRLLDALRALVP